MAAKLTATALERVECFDLDFLRGLVREKGLAKPMGRDQQPTKRAAWRSLNRKPPCFEDRLIIYRGS